MSGNPNPQHTPTDGLGVAAYVQLSGSSGSSVIESNGAAFPGQGTGAVPSGTHPVAQYGLTLSVSGAGGYASSLVVTADAVDAQNNLYQPSDLDSFTAVSYNNPSQGSPAWYNPSNFAGYNPNVASVATAGISGSSEAVTITALHPGQAIVEVAFATFDNTLGAANSAAGADTVESQPLMKIYVQVVVVVIP